MKDSWQRYDAQSMLEDIVLTGEWLEGLGLGGLPREQPVWHPADYCDDPDSSLLPLWIKKCKEWRSKIMG